MKKILALSVFIVIIATACHKKAVPAATQAASAPAPSAVAAADPALIEAGKNIYTTKCAKCHPAKVVENYTADRWVGILKSMIPKAKLDDTEAAQVTAYVNANAKK
ncbi:MAG: hypothetical protein WDO19_10290 [Bacteroidota bacterium]